MLDIPKERLLLCFFQALLLLLCELRQTLFDCLLLLLELDFASLEGVFSVNLDLAELLASLEFDCFQLFLLRLQCFLNLLHLILFFLVHDTELLFFRCLSLYTVRLSNPFPLLFVELLCQLVVQLPLNVYWVLERDL